MTTNQHNTTLPTREQFFATGFISTPAPADPSITECGICLDDFQTPVTIGCHPAHVFCHACIANWLKQADSCPSCKTKLFEVPPPLISPRQQVAQQANILLSQRSEPWGIQPFGAGPFQDTPEDVARLMTGSAAAFWWTARGHFGPGQVNINGEIFGTTGTGFIEIALLGPAFAMMGNYVPAVSEAQNRPYTAQQREHWTLVLTTLWNILRRYDGKSIDTSPQVLLKKLRKRLKKLPDFARIQFIHRSHGGFEDARLDSNMISMLDFIAAVTQSEQRGRVHHHEQEVENAWKKVKRIFKPIRDFGRWLVADL